MSIISVTCPGKIIYCKGVVVQRKYSRPPHILENVNGKEHPDPGRSEMSNPLPNTFWETGESLTRVFFSVFNK